MRFLVLLLITVSSFRAYPQNATFQVDATGTTPAIDSAIKAATDTWSWYLVSGIPIKIKITYLNMTTLGPLAITFPNGRLDFTGTPKAGLWYPLSLANAITGIDHSDGEYDMDIYMNSAKNWYTGLDGNPGAGQSDMISVVLHEIGHGLGFASLAKVDSLGSFGQLTAADYFPLTTSFPFPDLQGKPSVWDSFLEDGVSILLTDTASYPNPSINLSNAFSGNNVSFSGPLATTAWGTEPRVHAAGAFALGTSITHLNEITFPVSGGDALMTPFITAGTTTQDPGPVTLAILRDLGWMLAISPVKPASMDPMVVVAPNPSSDYVRFITPPGAVIRLFDLQGRSIDELSSPSGSIVWENHPGNGLIIYEVTSSKGTLRGKLLLMK